MRKETIESAPPSRTSWDTLETFAREKIQGFLQTLLEEEVTELVGRTRYARAKPVDGIRGYRNGKGKPRRFAMTCGTVTVRRPRVRGLEARFESRIVPLFCRRTKEVGELLPELYLHGLAQGDFELALRGLLGEGAPLSPSSIERLRAKWVAEYEAWGKRPLDDLEAVYLWADGIYVKAGLEDQKAAILVVIAALRDGTKILLALESGYRESTESWGRLLRDLRDRGLRSPRLVVGDGALGIWAALRDVFPQSEEQRCWNHKMTNVLDTLSRKEQPKARERLRDIAYAPTEAGAERLRDDFVAAYGNAYPKAAETLGRDWERMVGFYRFPKEHWKHLRTSNVVESPFAAVRLRTDAAKRYKKVANATALLWKLLRIAQSKFRVLDHPELLAEVAEGALYQDGVRIKKPTTLSGQARRNRKKTA